MNHIKALLIKHIPLNRSGSEVILSPGESILLIINACEKAGIELSIIDQLNQLYIEGVKTDKDTRILAEIKAIFAEKQFIVRSDPKIINEDPTRRYFETHLAYHILKNNAEDFNYSELHQFTENLKNRLYSFLKDEDQQEVDKIICGGIDGEALNEYELEYAELINRLLDHDYYGLSAQACQNLYEIACSTLLATLNTQMDTSIPLDIYSDSIFSMGMDGKGHQFKKTIENVKTSAKGLFKSTTPIPAYDDLVNSVQEDYAYEDCISPLVRAADHGDFMIESTWSQFLFSRQTQLYSNGISCTTLAQLRNIILEKRLGKPYLGGSLQKYMSVFAALMLHNSGGHSFFEIFEVLKLPLWKELTEAEPRIAKAMDEDTLMYQYLYVDQRDAYAHALKSTQKYQRILLNKKILHAQLIHDSEPKLEAYSTLHQAVINQNSEEFGRFIQDIKIDRINALNNAGWTALMVASQLGKTEHVKQLINAGADISVQADDLSALELAVKSQRHDTVEYLLNAGAVVKRNTLPKNIKIFSPALYLACRQNNIPILQMLFKYEPTFNIADKKKAIATALKVENISALKILIAHVNDQEKQLYFTECYQFKLLFKAAYLGSIRLIQEIINLNICPSSNKINYEELINLTAERGFLPTTRKLLELYYNDPNCQEQPINLDNALIIARKNNHLHAVPFFLANGANRSQEKTGHTLTLPIKDFVEFLVLTVFNDAKKYTRFIERLFAAPPSRNPIPRDASLGAEQSPSRFFSAKNYSPRADSSESCYEYLSAPK